MCVVLYAEEEGGPCTWHLVYAVLNGGVRLRALSLASCALIGKVDKPHNVIIESV